MGDGRDGGGTATGLRTLAGRLVLFLLIAAVPASALRELDRRFVRRTVDLQDAALEAGLAEVDTLIMGDSHAQDIDYRLTPDTFHIASPGESVIQSYYRLRYVVSLDPPRLERVVLAVGLHSLLRTKQARQDEPYWARRIDYLELARRSPDPLPVLAEALRGRIGFIGEGIAIWRGVRSALRDWRKGERPSTWDDRLGRWDRPTPDLVGVGDAAVASQVEHVVHGHVVYGAEQDPVVAGHLVDLLALCRASGLAALVVEAPVLEEYVERMRAVTDVPAHDRFVAQAVARTGADFLDLRHALSDRSDFSNPDHVSLKGRAEITRRVREHLGLAAPR